MRKLLEEIVVDGGQWLGSNKFFEVCQRKDCVPAKNSVGSMLELCGIIAFSVVQDYFANLESAFFC